MLIRYLSSEQWRDYMRDKYKEKQLNEIKDLVVKWEAHYTPIIMSCDSGDILTIEINVGQFVDKKAKKAFLSTVLSIQEAKAKKPFDLFPTKPTEPNKEPVFLVPLFYV